MVTAMCIFCCIHGYLALKLMGFQPEFSFHRAGDVKRYIRRYDHRHAQARVLVNGYVQVPKGDVRPLDRACRGILSVVLFTLGDIS